MTRPTTSCDSVDLDRETLACILSHAHHCITFSGDLPAQDSFWNLLREARGSVDEKRGGIILPISNFVRPLLTDYKLNAFKVSVISPDCCSLVTKFSKFYAFLYKEVIKLLFLKDFRGFHAFFLEA
jgi:hypothetical protein